MLDYGIAYYLIIGFLLLAGVRALLFPNVSKNIGGQSFSQELITPLRPLLILFVIAGHCDTMTSHASLLLQALHMGTPAVAVFFFISGYGLSASYEKKGQAYLHGFCWRSAVKLFVPFVFAAIIYQAVYYAFGDEFFSPRSWAVLRHAYLDAFLPHCWFVFALGFLYAVFYFVCQILRGGTSVLIITTVILFYMMFFMRVVHSPDCWWLTPLAFALGVAYYENEGRVMGLVAHFPMRVYFGLAISYALVVFLSLLQGKVGLLGNIGALTLCGPLVAIILVAFSFTCKRSFWVALGGVSYEMYLVHGIPKELLARFHLPPLLYFTVVCGASILLAFWLSMVIVPIKKMLMRRIDMNKVTEKRGLQ